MPKQYIITQAIKILNSVDTVVYTAPSTHNSETVSEIILKDLIIVSTTDYSDALVDISLTKSGTTYYLETGKIIPKYYSGISDPSSDQINRNLTINTYQRESYRLPFSFLSLNTGNVITARASKVNTSTVTGETLDNEWITPGGNYPVITVYYTLVITTGN
jgi:hypothetical protein